MSRDRWFLSALIVYHVVALALAALPSRDMMSRFVQTREPSTGVLPTAMDAVARVAYTTQRAVLSSSFSLRQLTQPYIEAGLNQRWNMFSRPSVYDRYLRLDYHVRSAGGQGLEPHRELIFPTADETRVRIAHRFRDKAVSAAVESYFIRDEAAVDDPTGPPAADAMIPIARHFTARFRNDHLATGASVVRTEIWHGTAPMPPPGERQDPDALAARLAILGRYRDPSAAAASSGAHAPRVGTTTREADLTWMLLYVEEDR